MVKSKFHSDPNPDTFDSLEIVMIMNFLPLHCIAPMEAKWGSNFNQGQISMLLRDFLVRLHWIAWIDCSGIFGRTSASAQIFQSAEWVVMRKICCAIPQPLPFQTSPFSPLPLPHSPARIINRAGPTLTEPRCTPVHPAASRCIALYTYKYTSTSMQVQVYKYTRLHLHASHCIAILSNT